MPLNSLRVLLRWGLGEFLHEKVVEPASIKLRRWENGAEIGCTKLVPDHRREFGAPYYVVHRAHFHDSLHKLAAKLGAKIKIGSRVSTYDPCVLSATLEGGQTVDADLVIAADGIKSIARIVLSREVAPRQTGFAAYRATVDADRIRADPETAWILEQMNINLWIGDGRHAMTYPISSGRSFNMVLSHPSMPVVDEPQPEVLDEMKANFAGWSKPITKLITFVHHASKWPLLSLPSIATYVHPSSKLALVGDSGHAMLPYMSQGAAMAVEDGAALAEALLFAHCQKDIPSVMKVWNKVRVERDTQMQQASWLNSKLWHFKDGPEQQARDAAMKHELSGERLKRSSPNQWSDDKTASWCFAYDAEAEIRRQFNHRVLVEQR